MKQWWPNHESRITMPEWPNIDRDGDGSSKPQNRDKQEDREDKHAVVAENKTKQGRRKKGQRNKKRKMKQRKEKRTCADKDTKA